MENGITTEHAAIYSDGENVPSPNDCKAQGSGG